MAFRRPYFRVVGNPETPGGFMEGYDGASWEWYRVPGIVVRTVGAAAGATRRGADFEGPLVDHRAKGSTVILGEPADIDDRAAYRLTVTTRDGFVRDYFIDQESYLIVAERRTAPFHAFGKHVTSETRIDDYRPVAGVLFAHRYTQTEIATGKELNAMQWSKIEANRDLPSSWFSPPEFSRTRLQAFLEHLYQERTDEQAVMWTYTEFRQVYPEINTRAGIEFIGYQMLKMGEVDQAITLLQANASNYPQAASSAFALGRAHATAGDVVAARTELQRALSLDPEHRRAKETLRSLD